MVERLSWLTWPLILTFGILSTTMSLRIQREPVALIVAVDSLWIILPIAIVFGFFLWARKRADRDFAIRMARRNQPGYCSVCGWDIRGTPGRCPECEAIQKQLIENGDRSEGEIDAFLKQFSAKQPSGSEDGLNK
jgi:hypothetical protein